MYHIMYVEHVCTINTCPICMYYATTYKYVDFVVLVIGILN